MSKQSTNQPMILEPQDGMHTDALAIDFAWKPSNMKSPFRIQIANDRDFDDVVFESRPIQSDRFTLFDTLYPNGNTYYWRLATQNGEQWSWGNATSFIADQYKEIMNPPSAAGSAARLKNQTSPNSPFASWNTLDVSVTSNAQAWGVLFVIVSMMVVMAAILLMA